MITTKWIFQVLIFIKQVIFLPKWSLSKVWSCCIFPCRVIHRCQGHREWEPDSLVIVPLCWPPTSSIPRRRRENLLEQRHFSTDDIPVCVRERGILFQISLSRLIRLKIDGWPAAAQTLGSPCQMQQDQKRSSATRCIKELHRWLKMVTISNLGSKSFL